MSVMWKNMSKKQKCMLSRILLAVLLCVAVRLTGSPVLYLIPYLLIGWDVLWRALKGISRGQVFDEHFLMSVATIGAMGIGEFPEAAAVMLFYQIGEFFQDYAVNRSRRSIAELMDIAPETAVVEKEDGVEEVDPDEVEIGQVLLVKPGERVPLDGIIVSGSSALDTSALTGESVPRAVSAGDEIISGCVNLSAALRVRTTKRYEDSTVARVLALVEEAGSRKARAENFITRFCRWYTPVVVIAAVVMAAIPPLMLGAPFGPWIRRACIFLIVSCPCALVVSVPLSFFGGIGAASAQGILVKGSSYLEKLAQPGTVVFDKTGTLTRGQFRVQSVLPAKDAGIGTEELVKMAAVAERYSTHPVAQAVLRAAGETDEADECREYPGEGVCAHKAGHRILAGNHRLLERFGIKPPELADAGTAVLVARDDQYLGMITAADEEKPGLAGALAGLRAAGARRLVMLTGDRTSAAMAVGEALGMDEIHAELLPADKVAAVESLIEEQRNGSLVYVGDGINDAPVLARADVGIAMGAMGSDAAIEAADVVLMTDDIAALPLAVRIAVKTMRIVKENITFALAVKAVILMMGALGMANLWMAVFGDVGVTCLAVLNAMRALRAR